MRILPIIALTLLAATLRATAQGPPPSAPPRSPIDVQAEFERRRSALTRDDLDTAVTLAHWAIDRGLLDDADALYRAVLHANRQHEGAYHGLHALAESRGTARDSETLKRTRSSLPAGFESHETHHYVVLSDADPRWVRQQGQNLERAHRQFVRFAAALELRPLPIRHKLVAVAFSRHGTFRRFADADGVPPLPVAGYYSTRDDHLVFYHVESGENIAAARAQLEQLNDEAASLWRASRRARNTGRRDEVDAMREELERRRSRVDARQRELNMFAHRWSVSVTMHEAIHQLAHHTGLQPLSAPPPIWLSEGLATAFETDDPLSPFGPGHEYAPRRDAFWALLDSGRLLPLEELVTMTSPDAFGSQAKARTMYDQSYAFVTWLCDRRKIELRRYFERLQETPAGDRNARLGLFVEVFGEIDRVEEAWLQFERAE